MTFLIFTVPRTHGTHYYMCSGRSLMATQLSSKYLQSQMLIFTTCFDRIFQMTFLIFTVPHTHGTQYYMCSGRSLMVAQLSSNVATPR